jgi:cyclic lactone autoinducer peptide
MKKSIVKAATLCAGFLTFLAAMASASACWIWFYQPEEPKSLRKE